MTFKLLFNTLALIFLIYPCWVQASEGKQPPAPIQIEADHMISNQKENSVFFSGKVIAEQDDILIHADEMTVIYLSEDDDGKSGDKETKGAGSRKIHRLIAVGHVEISKGEWVAKGDSAEYFELERKVVLKGHTKVWQDNNLVTGDTFILYLDEGKSIVERNSQKEERVKAIFYPDSNSNK